jgi:plastocyanin
MLTESKRKILTLSCALLIVCVCMMAVMSTTTSAHETHKSRTWHAVVGVESRDHAIQGLVFLPTVLYINVGDTVVWTANAGDIHTVTFLRPGQPLPPFTGSPEQINRVGGNVYNGKDYFNSGLLSNFPGVAPFHSYSLTFGVPGDFVYHCLVHPSMMGIVHVQPAGTIYPFSQEDYNEQIQSGTQEVLHNGQKLTHIAEEHSSNQHVIVGSGNAMVSVVRFFPSQITIHVGDTVTFKSRDAGNPHTVTFGPTPQNENQAYGNPQDFHGQPLSSGILFFGQTFRVTFKQAGVFSYRCLFHDYLGMVGTVTVLK